jgi:hypothetical protein
VDVYEPGPGSQIVDLNPGIAPSGLFWTMAVPPESVRVVDPGDDGGADDDSNDDFDGGATVRLRNVAVTDFHDFGNALFGGGPPPVPATLSYEVRWSRQGEVARITNEEQGFTGKYVRNQAQMEWAATSGDFSYRSGPASTSSSVFAEVGHERNGSFFPNP